MVVIIAMMAYTAARVSPAYGSGHVRSQTVLLDSLVQHRDGFALRDEEPAAAKAHHRVPHQADRRRRELDLGEPLPAIELVDRRRFLQLRGDGDERVVEAERHVPRLRGKDGEDARALDPEQAPWKKRQEPGHCDGEKSQHRNRLENVQQRQHDFAGANALGGDISVNERKQECERKGNEHSHHGPCGVIRYQREVE
jgi:hypothetical protein